MYYPASALLIEAMVLSTVEKHDSYGYEISQVVKRVANIKESTMYPILSKLEKGNFLSAYSAEYQGRNRKYYSLTEEGKNQLAFLREEWEAYRDAIDEIVEGSVEQ
ncbi:MAG: PadR family transcriptional regulator [Peptostreptococcaceae bacterium]|nr:PadR family transcriptional regulator [Peptostreptococcaceae bacterium]MDY5738378.1 PadR family transcriptional regulator [Anaerovoracaceae bacterium]SFE33642.1 PadR family transcriptional regulator, regulatory protein PadR [Peptostreptococcaceae bacterium pGA-8]